MSGGVQTHELQLKINAAAAETGAKRFKSAIASIKRAVEGLERSTDGSFKSLQKSLNIPAGSGSTEKALRGQATAAKTAETASTRLATATKNAMTSATGQAAKLRTQFEAMGDTAGIDRVNAALAKLQASAKAAGSTADLGAAKADYRAQIAGLTDTAKAQKLAALGAQDHAAELDRLKTKYDPIYAASRLYEKQLGEVNAAHKAGVLSADQHQNAIDHLNTQLQMGTVSSNKYAQSVRVSSMHMSGYTANIVSQFNDIGVMLASGQSPFILAMQQGTQLSQVLNQMGGRGGVLSALKSGFMTMINPISILTIGSIALGAALVQAFTKAMPKTVSFKEAIEDAGTAIREAASAAGEVRDFSTMVSAYGGATRAVRELIAAKAELAKVTATEALNASKSGLASDDLWTRLANSLRGYTGDAQGQIRRIRDELDLSKVQATALNSALTDAINTDDPAQYADALRGVRGQLTAAAGGVEGMTGKQRAFYQMLVESEDKARQLAALDMASPVGAAADEATRLAEQYGLSLGLARQLAAVGKQSKNTVSGFEGNDPRNPGNKAKWTGGYSTSWDAWTPKKSAATGGASVLDGLTRTTNSLEAQNIALKALQSGLFETTTAADAYAQAMLAGGGAVDQATMDALKNADAVASANEQLQKIVQTNKSGGGLQSDVSASVQGGLKSGLAAALKGDTANFAATLGESIYNSVANALADAFTEQLFAKNAASTGVSWLTAIFGAGSEGGYSEFLPGKQEMPIAAFNNAPHYAEGTANTSNGIPSILHPNEAVVPLSRGRKIPVDIGGAGGGVTVGDINTNVTVEGGDDSPENAARIGEAVRVSIEGMIDTKMAESVAYGGIMNPRGGR